LHEGPAFSLAFERQETRPDDPDNGMTRSSLQANQNKLHQSYLFERVIQNGPKEEYQGRPAKGI
jgi:hypothetical protein